MATIPNGQGALGIPATYTETLTVPYGGLLLGSSPLPVVEDRIFAANQTIPAFTPVGLDGSGRLIPAVQGTTQAIAITLTEVVCPNDTNYKGAPVLVQGAVDYDVVAWPASYDLAAERFDAFKGAPSPTAIIVKRRSLGSL